VSHTSLALDSWNEWNPPEDRELQRRCSYYSTNSCYCPVATTPSRSQHCGCLQPSRVPLSHPSNSFRDIDVSVVSTSCEMVNGKHKSMAKQTNSKRSSYFIVRCIRTVLELRTMDEGHEHEETSSDSWGILASMDRLCLSASPFQVNR
jgi:hypothetical protein